MQVRLGATALLTVSIALAAIGFGAPATATGPETQTGSAEASQEADHDPTIKVDQDGFRYVIDPAHEQPSGELSAPPPPRAQASTAQAGLAIPALSSRSTSTRTVYLDFNGINLPSSSAWHPNIPAGEYTGFTLDSNQDFSAAEIAFIEKTWRITAEKFAPFDLNVTTIAPEQAALARTNEADTAYGIQVVITDDLRPRDDICARNCAGIAYLDLFDGRQFPGPGLPSANPNFVFNTDPFTVAWAFSSATFGSAQLTALDIAHEVGHTLGLSHDGDNINPSYYEGHENWVPIMGLTTQNAVSQFSKGEYTGANNTEDDLVVISRNGPTGTPGSLILADDYTTASGLPTGAAALGSQPSYAVAGVITNAADDDLFSIARTCTDPLTATATGIGSGQSLDIKVDILNGAGSVLASNDPASGPNSSQPGDIGFVASGLDATATLPSTTAGTTYLVRVDGAGSANPANTGYSDYGSIGQYALTITGCNDGPATVPGAPAGASATPNPRTRTGSVTWTAPASNGGSPVTGYRITGLPGGDVVINSASTTSYAASNLVPGTSYSVNVFARNTVGESTTGRSTTLQVQTWAPTTRPTLSVTRSGSTATLTWTAPAITGGAVLTGWQVDRTGPGASPADTITGPATSTTMSGLAVGSHTFTVRGIYTASDTAGVLTSNPVAVVVTTKPGAPRIGTASSGAKGGTKSAVVRWSPPSSTGGAAIARYTVIASRVVGGKVTRTFTSSALSGSARSLVFRLPAGSYKFQVVASNSVGSSPASAFSRVVLSR